MGDGLYAARMGGGSVNPATGEFNFAVHGGLSGQGRQDLYARARRDAWLARARKFMMKIDRVGRDMQHGVRACAAAVSGSVPTNVGQPMIRVSSLTVGGHVNRRQAWN